MRRTGARGKGGLKVHSIIKGLGKVSFVGFAVGLVICSGASGPAKGQKSLNLTQKGAIKRGLDANHQAFIENKGQWDRRAEFRAQTGGLDYWLTTKGVTFDYHRPGTAKGKLTSVGQVVKMTFEGGDGVASVTGAGRKSNTARYMSKGSGKMLSPKAYA